MYIGMQQPDAEIVDAHQTKLGNYAVHVSIPGLEGTKAFTNIAPEHLSEFVKCFLKSMTVM